jgi:hypothetical protein
MSRSVIAAAAVALLASPALAEDRSFNLSGFDKVAVAGSDNVDIHHGSSFRVVATGPADELDKLELVVERGELKIGRKRQWWRWNGEDVKVSVTMPTLHGVRISGSANVAADRGDGPAFAMAISGSGDMKVAAVDAAKVALSISGSGDVTAAGRCTSVDVKISGSGNAMLAGLKCTNADVSVAGSGDVAAHASTAAMVRVAGSGDVRITGGGRCTKKVAGSGTVTCS